MYVVVDCDVIVYFALNFYILCVSVLMNLHITAQSDPVILAILCHSH